ncbi:MAG: recombination protein RecR [Oceanicoccus sp.]|jgi:recombination protein RecR
MDFLPNSVSRLIDELGRLPGIGPKSAQRLAFHLLKQNTPRNQALGDSITKIKEGVVRCQECQCLTSQELCSICENPSRDQSTLCIVETTLDMIALEKTREYKGRYHVLQGRLSPLDGIGPEQLTIYQLFERLTAEDSQITEVILALNPDLEGDTTALFLQRKMSTFNVLQVSRIARGIPSGGHLEYTDDATLIRALQGRQSMS